MLLSEDGSYKEIIKYSLGSLILIAIGLLSWNLIQTIENGRELDKRSYLLHVVSENQTFLRALREEVYQVKERQNAITGNQAAFERALDIKTETNRNLFRDDITSVREHLIKLRSDIQDIKKLLPKPATDTPPPIE